VSTVLGTLGETLRGELISPEDSSYDEARAVYNAMIDRRPAGIARCLDAADVGKALQFARAEGLTIAIRMELQVNEVLLIADAMTGQESVRVAEEFNARLPLSGLILTKMDGDAKGGAALSIRAVTQIPIKFISTGEKTDALEPFYPDRLASRILGMGDMLTLIEKAEETMDRAQAEAMEKKLRTNSFTLEDFLAQLQQIKKMGSLSQLVEMMGMRTMLKESGVDGEIDERPLKKVEAIINSMTLQERRDPHVLDGSRKRRIAKGSGTTVQDINQLLVQFRDMQNMMKQLTSGKMGKLMSRMMGKKR
jgi:signal recognition particle subunit SRP54